jgi:hypothetical protein
LTVAPWATRSDAQVCLKSWNRRVPADRGGDGGVEQPQGRPPGRGQGPEGRRRLGPFDRLSPGPGAGGDKNEAEHRKLVAKVHDAKQAFYQERQAVASVIPMFEGYKAKSGITKD